MIGKMEAPKYAVAEWLDTYTKASSRRLNAFGLKKFCTVMEMRPEDLKTLEGFEIRNLLLQFQRALIDNGTKPNSARSYISAVRNYCDFFGVAVPRSKRLVKQESAQGYHIFSNGDLETLFTYADTRMKAFLAIMTSTGWSIDDVLRLPRKLVETKLAKNEDGFIFFEWTRHKTGAKALCILNPLACEWLKKWLHVYDGPGLFNCGYGQFDVHLKQLAKETLKLEGTPRLHNLRKWTITTMDKAGFTPPQWKYIVGKKTPQSDATYLQRLKETIKEKYPQKYADHLAIIKPKPVKSADDEARGRIEKLEKRLQGQAEINADLRIKIGKYDETISKWSEQIKRIDEQSKRVDEGMSNVISSLSDVAQKQSQQLTEIFEKIQWLVEEKERLERELEKKT